MALQKKTILEHTGIVANYHVITDMKKEHGRIAIEVKGYTSKEYRDKELATYEIAAEMRNLQYSTNQEELERYHELLSNYPDILYRPERNVCADIYFFDAPEKFSYEEAYNYLKTLPEFEGAEDV